MKKVIIDMFGGDNGPAPIIEGALDVLSERGDFTFVFAGDPSIVQKIGAQRGLDLSRVEYLPTDKFISNHDDPRAIIHSFEDTSLVKSLLAAKNDPEVEGFLSCGNTGAVLLGSIFRLGMVAGIKAPVLACSLPILKTGGRLCLLDCGANLDCSPERLLEFAYFGSAFAQASSNLASPRIGLLNVGKEEGKGTELYRNAYGLIKNSHLNFVGNVEGSDLFSGLIDVCVCDGFLGNVVLKNSEAVALSLRGLALSMKDQAQPDGQSSLSTLADHVYSNFAYNDLGCSWLLGASRLIAKPHGAADRKTIVSSLHDLFTLSDGRFIGKLNKTLETERR